MKIFRTLLILIILASALLCAGSYFYPVSCQNSCKESNMYRYKMGIYEMKTGLTGNKEYHKTGGLAMFLGIKPIVCPEEAEKQHYASVMKSIDSANKAEGWKFYKNGLWISKSGDLAIKEIMAIGPEGMEHAEHYISRMEFDEDKPLNSIIDTATFRKLSESFYKDRKHIYRYYGMAYGGSFSIFSEADPLTFEVLSECYAKDKNHIYESREGILNNVDYQTFKTKSTVTGCFAKDRHGFLQWGDRIPADHMKDEYVQKAVRELNQP